MLRNSKEKLQNLKISISRINNSDFGICIKCKNPINFKRILLIPEVLKCVNCG
jgi:DnaK suppressor protein